MYVSLSCMLTPCVRQVIERCCHVKSESCWKSPGRARLNTSSAKVATLARDTQTLNIPSCRNLFSALRTSKSILYQHILSYPNSLPSTWPTERSSQSPSTTSSRLVSQQHAPEQQSKRPSLTLLQGRQKRKNEQLAQDIFGKNRRQSAPAAGNTKKTGPIGGSLASRVGVTKVCLADERHSSRASRLTISTAHSIDPSLE